MDSTNTHTTNVGTTTSKEGNKNLQNLQKNQHNQEKNKNKIPSLTSSKPPPAGPSAYIATAFRSGVRKTRSTTGTLPPGSANEARALRLNQPLQLGGRQEHTDQSFVPDPTPMADITEQNVRNICSTENQPIINRVTTLESADQVGRSTNESHQLYVQQLKKELEEVTQQL